MAVTIEGLARITKRLDKLASGEKVRQQMGQACALVEAAGKQNAPKDTGALRRSIESRVEERGGDIVGEVFTPLEHAPYVEYGTGLFAEAGGRQEVPWKYVDDEGKGHITSGMHPRPYLRPALNANKKEIKRILMEGFKDG